MTPSVDRPARPQSVDAAPNHTPARRSGDTKGRTSGGSDRPSDNLPALPPSRGTTGAGSRDKGEDRNPVGRTRPGSVIDGPGTDPGVQPRVPPIGREGGAARVTPNNGGASGNERDLVGRTDPISSGGVTRRDIAAGAGGAALSGITSDTLGGVRLDRPAVTGGELTAANPSGLTGVHQRGDVIVNGDNNTVITNSTVNYITNVNQANDCWVNPVCPPVWGPGSCWQGWGSNDGFSFGIGFGSGNFSFGLFWGSNNTPFCSSWCDPWWGGWSGFVSVGCAPSWGWARPCWSPCGGPWWSSYIVVNSCPSWCAPVYPWTPVWAVPTFSTIGFTTIVETVPETIFVPVPSTVTTAVYDSPQPASISVLSTPSPSFVASAAEVEAWDLLANGFPRSAADTFAQLHDANPANLRALVGYATSLAMLDDIPAAAAVLRQAVASDPAVLVSVPLGPTLTERVQLLAQSAEIASRQTSLAREALFVLAAWRTALGRFTEAHLAIVAAQQQGDGSVGAATLRAWLEQRLAPRA